MFEHPKFYLLQDEYNNKNTLGFLSLSPYPRNTSFGPLRLWERMKPTYQQDRDMFSCFIILIHFESWPPANLIQC